MNTILFADIVAAGPMLLECLMLLSFGVAWPLANLRMLRHRRAEGKGLGFTLIILFGYAAGAIAKLLMTTHGSVLAPVFWLYLLNGASVALNLFLQWHYGRRLIAVPTPTAAVAVG